MISIFICEDNSDYLNILKSHIENYVAAHGLAIRLVYAVTDPYQILNHLKSSEKTPGLYFLDLTLGCDIDGIQLAKQIRAYDPFGCIVFITSDAKSYELTFKHKVAALDYIEKADANLVTRIHDCIQYAYNKLTAITPKQNHFVFKFACDAVDGKSNFSKNSMISVSGNDILYISTSPERKRVIEVHTKESRMLFHGNLANVEEQMDKHFYRCQQSYIINLDVVKAVDPKRCQITFDNNQMLNISPKQVKKLAQRVEEHQIYREK